jgi:hypothetical protein
LTGERYEGDHTGGSVEGAKSRPTGKSNPRDVVPRVGPEGKPVFKLVYDSLDELLQWFAPDALWITQDWISETVCEVGILSLDYKQTVWLASLSLDLRWTLSPRAGPWQGVPITIDWG